MRSGACPRRGRAPGGLWCIGGGGSPPVLALAGVLVLAVGIVGTMTHLRGNLTTSPRAPSRRTGSRECPDGTLNILLLGSDSRDLAEESFGEGDGSRRSDAMVLAHLSADDDRIDAVQLPRDTLMDLPACSDTGEGTFSGGRGMLNSALNFGPACSVAAVEELTGVRVDHFVEVDFEGFMAIIDALGGLPVCLSGRARTIPYGGAGPARRAAGLRRQGRPGPRPHPPRRGGRQRHRAARSPADGDVRRGAGGDEQAGDRPTGPALLLPGCDHLGAHRRSGT